MRSRKILNINRGSILIELSIAIAVCALSFTAIASLIFNRQIHAVHMQNYREALFLAVSNLEKMRVQAATNVLALQDLTSTTAHYISPCLLKLSSTAFWDSTIKNTVSFSSLFTDTTTAKNVDSDCEGSYLPITISSTSTPHINTILLAGTSTAFDVINTMVYITQTIESTSTLSIFKSVNENLLSLGNTLLSLPVMKLDATKDTVYVALNGTHDQFQIVDVKDSSNPKIIASASLPGVAGEYPAAASITYYNQKVYVGTHRTAGHEFHIFDVSAGAAHWLGSIELNHNINSIAIREPYAFLATSGNTKDLIILDISNPQRIKQLSSLSLTGNEDALSLFLIGQKIYLGRKKSLKPADEDIDIISIADPVHPIVIAKNILQKNIVGLKTYDDYTFLASFDTTSSLTIVSSADLKQIQSVPLPYTIKDVDYENRSAYILSDKALTSITFLP